MASEEGFRGLEPPAEGLHVKEDWGGGVSVILDCWFPGLEGFVWYMIRGSWCHVEHAHALGLTLRHLCWLLCVPVAKLSHRNCHCVLLQFGLC